jgi:ornithine carbamoyltransferase
MSRFGMDITLAYPDGYGLIPDIVDIARENAKISGGNFEINNSMEEAVKDADIVYPKSWAPFHIMQQRTELLKNADKQGLQELEKTCLAQNARFLDWEYEHKKMQLTKNADALYMHCLPADISGVSCKQGEVSADTFEKYRIQTYLEAGYKPYIIAAMIFASKVENPGEMLKKLFENKKVRFSC